MLLFENSYLNVSGPVELIRYKVNEEASENGEDNVVTLEGMIHLNNKEITIQGNGNGPISAFLDALDQANVSGYTVTSYDEHAREEGDKSQAIAYVQVENLANNRRYYGVGISPNITSASIKAIVSALNRSLSS